MASCKTKVYVIKWVENGEEFFIAALSVDSAHAAYKEINHFSRGISGREELALTLGDICTQTGVPLDDALNRFSGPGSKTEFLFISPRGLT